MRFVEFKVEYRYAGDLCEKGSRCMMGERDFQELYILGVVQGLDNLATSISLPDIDKMIRKPKGMK